MTWIGKLLNETEIYEAPREYYFWSGLAAISAAVKDNVWISRASEKFKTYPNIYVMLLAKTGVTRKSHPPSLIEQIVTKANVTRVISGRGSIEKVLDDLGTAVTLENNGHRKLVKDSCGFLISGELSASFINNSQTLTILTNLYDRNYNTDKWKVNLKSGVKTLTRPTISFLAATNDQHMKSWFEAKDMYGGFLGRTFVISADAPKRLNALLRKSPETMDPDIDGLAKYLQEVSAIKGEMCIEDEVISIYEKWYEGYYGPVQRNEADVDDKTGTFSRIGDHVLKVATLLSLSESPHKIITKNNMLESISLCEPFVEISQRAVRGIGKASLAQQTAMVMEYLELKGGFATRIAVLQRFSGDIDHEDLNRIATTLEESGFISIERYGNGVAYQVPIKVLEKYKKWKEAKKGGDS
jgi:hypothetical protein